MLANISVKEDISSQISLTNNKNNKGPTLEPWGTPDIRSSYRT